MKFGRTPSAKPTFASFRRRPFRDVQTHHNADKTAPPICEGTEESHPFSPKFGYHVRPACHFARHRFEVSLDIE
jgi:hypothetical protein